MPETQLTSEAMPTTIKQTADALLLEMENMSPCAELHGETGALYMLSPAAVLLALLVA